MNKKDKYKMYENINLKIANIFILYIHIIICTRKHNQPILKLQKIKTNK